MSSTLFAQLIRNDDFQFQNDYWVWRSDGVQDPPYTNNGLLVFKLIESDSSGYNNVEIYDPEKPYLPGIELRMRLKSSKMHYGSRGWGLWDHDKGVYFIIDYDVAWVMQQKSPDSTDPNFNWLQFGSSGDTINNRQTIDLSQLIDETKWNTYKIRWESNAVFFYVDDLLIFETYQHIPDEGMRLDIWTDNMVTSLTNPTDQQIFKPTNSEILVDFIEISGLEGPSINRELTNNIVLWDSPNTFPIGEREVLFKNYSFNITDDGDALIFITGSAESYGNNFEDDDLKIVLNNFDYGWDSENSLNGFNLNGRGKSVVFTSQLEIGENNLQIHTDITPFLRDVIVLNSPEGKTLFTENYHQTINSEDGLWKTIEFDSHNSNEITILISGTGNMGDALRFELNDTDFGWEGENSIDGNSLQGIPNTVALTGNLIDGKNFLKIYKSGNPQIYSVAAYGSSNITNVENESQLPNLLSLKVYPNPFNIEAKITYTTNSASQNKLKIYNSLGENIATLVNEFQPKGSYKVNWDADHQSSGIYFCILEVDNYFTTEKLLLLK